MAEFFDASHFAQLHNEDEPRLREALGDDQPIDDMQGKVLVFGGRDGIEPDAIEDIQQHLQDGLDLPYILDELTDLEVRTSRETTIGGLVISYVELTPRESTVEALSVEELEAMYLASPDEDDR